MEIDPSFDEEIDTLDSGGVDDDGWTIALKRVVPAVVVLRVIACRDFDTYTAGSGQATGFVVDKDRGIILTNRHVVKPGPITAEAIFTNGEEIPIHDFGFFRYDPGAIQFLSYEEIPLAPEAAFVGLPIRVVGNDNRDKVSIASGIIGRLDREAPQYNKEGYNDFNTFYIQVASGTRGGSSGSPVINRQGKAVALNAGSKSIGTRGGSSVSSFLLPLERVVRALKFLQEGRVNFTNSWEAFSIPRGTLQATFLHKGFDETRKLGLQSDTEQFVRNSSPLDETGMLVVESVVPGGPADDYLEPGDILFHINGEVITRFLKLEMILDDNVGQQIELQIGRGGISMTIQLLVQDLHSITPGYFLEVSGAVIHPLSYQQARNFHFQCGLVYVAKPGYMLFRAGVPRHSIIKKFAGEDILRLEDLISVLSKLSSGARVPLEYINYTNRHQRKFVLVTLDRHEWYAPPQMYTRDDSSGLWMAKPVLSSGSLLLSGTDPDNQVHRSVSCAGEAPMNETAQHFDHKSIDSITDMLTSHKLVSEKDSLSADEFVISDGSSQVLTKERLIDTTIDDVVVRDCKGLVTKSVNAFVPERVVEPTLVMLEVHVPSSCMLDGVQSQHFFGTGVVVYHSETVGLVVVDMETVAVSVSDVFLSFAAFPIEIPGEVVFLHPTHNFAFVAYDPKALGNIGASAVHAAELLAEPPLCRGDTVSLVGLNKCLQTKSRKSIVTNACASLTIATSGCPHYIATNMEVIELDTAFGDSFSGVLTDELGRVRALWGSFSKPKNKNLNDSSSSDDSEFTRGIPACAISKLLAKIISTAAGPPHLLHGFKQHMPLVRILEAKLHPTLLSKARNFGLSDSWIQALVKKDPVRRQVLRVECCFAGSRAQKVLEQGDMILAINKEAVTCFRDIEDACQALDQCANSDGMLHMTIFRQGCEIELLVGTDERDGSGTTRAISWCGCTVQEPHLAVRAHGFLPRQSGVYVARVSKGSPASRYGLSARQWIVNINGKKTPDLDAFIRITKELEHGKFVRLRTVNLNGKRGVVTLKQDLHYWPTWEISFDSCETLTWRRKIISALDGGAM